jgi:hypothetical protein
VNVSPAGIDLTKRLKTAFTPCERCGILFRPTSRGLHKPVTRYCSHKCASGPGRTNGARPLGFTGYTIKGREKIYSREKARIYQNDLRQKVLAALGGVCVKCGFEDERVLQVDHIAGNGADERREVGRGSRAIYKKVLKDSSGYQLLCANCNWIKRIENEEAWRRLPGDNHVEIPWRHQL